MGKHSAPKRRVRPYALAALVPVGLVSAVAAAHAGQQLTMEPAEPVAGGTPELAETSSPTTSSQTPVDLPITTEPAAVAAPEPAPAPKWSR